MRRFVFLSTTFVCACSLTNLDGYTGGSLDSESTESANDLGADAFVADQNLPPIDSNATTPTDSATTPTDAAPAPDTAFVDSINADSVVPDTSPADTAVADTHIADTSVADTAPPDTGTPDTSTPDTGTPDTGPTPTSFTVTIDNMVADEDSPTISPAGAPITVSFTPVGITLGLTSGGTPSPWIRYSGWPSTLDVNCQAAAASTYYHLRITPSAGTTLSFSSFEYWGSRSSTGPVYWVLDGSIDLAHWWYLDEQNQTGVVDNSTTLDTPITIDLATNWPNVSFAAVTDVADFEIVGCGASSTSGYFGLGYWAASYQPAVVVKGTYH